MDELILVKSSDLKIMITECIENGVSKILKESKNPELFNEYPSFVTKKQAVEMLKLSLVTVNTWLKNGKLKKYKIDGSVRIKKADILELVEVGLVRTYPKKLVNC